jgi:hypothetical protein
MATKPTKEKEPEMKKDQGEDVPVETGAGLGNLSGTKTAPERAMDVIREAQRTPPDPKGDSRRLAEFRKPDIQEGVPIGSLPEPSPDAVDAAGSSRLFDKLGERLAFERQGVRLYECLVGKVKALGKTDAGPSTADLEEILAQEREHFDFLRQAIVQAGGDPTAQTPSADIAGVLAQGLVQVVSDPRTTVAQCLQAMLQAELADNDGWELLQRLAASQGEVGLVSDIEAAKENEAEHLEKVRAWLSEWVIGEMPKGAKAKSPAPEAKPGIKEAKPMIKGAKAASKGVKPAAKGKSPPARPKGLSKTRR